MKATFDLCKKLIGIGKGNVVNANIDIYLLNNRLTEQEYTDLIAMLNPEESQ